MKRFACMLMAMAMTLALAVPAFATTLTTGDFAANSAGETRNLAGSTKTPVIQVLVPAADANTDKLILNPYALPVQASAVISGDTSTTPLKDQVISKAMFLGSLSDVPLKVGMKVVATPSSNVLLSSKSLVGDTRTTTKSVFLWGQVVEATNNATIPTTFATAYDATAGKTGDMILLAAGADGVTRTGMYTLPISTDTNDASKATWACAKFFGDAVKAPTEAWNDDDKVDLAITFSFVASMNE